MDELKEARERADISQGALAARLDKSQTMLSRIESGEREPEPGFAELYRATLRQMIDERDTKAKALLDRSPTPDAAELAVSA